MTSKCGKNKEVAHEAQYATWNLFVLYNKELKYTEKVLMVTSSIRLSSNRSWVRTNQNACITELIYIYIYIYYKHLNFDSIVGIGWASVIIVQFLNIYYIVILGWALFYMFASFQSVLPWSRCGNDWNTPNCVDYVTSEKGSSIANTTVIPTVMANMSNMSTVPTAVAKAAKVSASEEYFEWVKL